ncbi:Pseudaminic acid biosynthesis-associated protein PseG [Candidatus Zixiibacteriota bacterium]|nr:Pseudaminic acid biosynthesis-associated protein PseG [candidate division Zixibacteria bacterium]
MKVIIRTDSSELIGTGHLTRCLTLAEKLRADGAEVSFICRDLPGNMKTLVSKKGYKLHLLPQEKNSLSAGGYASWLGVRWYADADDTAQILATENPDLLVVDHYALDARWEERMRPYAGHIMVIDDLANRHHDCDIFLDQNYHDNPAGRYEMLLPDGCAALYGPQYALLRQEFAVARKNMVSNNDNVQRIFVFFGGIDPNNETMKALGAIGNLQIKDMVIDIVIGSANRNKDKIGEMVPSIAGATLHCQIDNMAELMAKADIAIGAGGTTTWERCCLGLPSVIIAVAENQIPIAESCHTAGVGIYLGRAEEVSSERIGEAFRSLIEQPSLLSEMKRKAREMCDGLGTDRVSRAIYKTVKAGVTA